MNLLILGANSDIALAIARTFAGAEKADLVLYSNSGDVTGDQSEVVGYAGVMIS